MQMREIPFDTGENLRTFVEKPEPISLYVHVPFCEQKCAYCDFFTITDPDKNHPLYAAWLDICFRELILWRDAGHFDSRRTIQSIFFGGGTPSLLPAESFQSFLNAVKSQFVVADDCEVSLETQPGTIAENRFGEFANAGINRFSIGVQTFNESLLSPTGRRHTVAETMAAIRGAVATGQTVSFDLICAHPGQTLEDWRKDLETAATFPVKHISIYEMTYHPGTQYFRHLRKGKLAEIHEDSRIAMFEMGEDFLKNLGFDHYEISNYALPGYESRHNANYWKLGDYIGLGAGAHGFIHPHRWQNPRHADHYASAVFNGKLFAKLNDAEDIEITRIENLTAALRYKTGVNLHRFARLHNCDLMEWRGDRLRALERDGLIIIEENFIRLTKSGRLQADSIAESLL